MLVMFWLNVMSRWSLLTVLGQRNSPEKLAEFITVESAASECRFWTEKEGFEGESVGELKWAVIPMEVWSIGVDMPWVSVGVALSKLKTTVMGGAGVGDGVGVGEGDGEGVGVVV